MLSFLVDSTPASTSNNRRSAARNNAAAAASVPSEKPLRQETLLRLHPEVVNYPLKKFGSDQTIANIDSAILRYTQSKSMIPSSDAVG